MNYIPADKLIAEIEKRKYEVFPTGDGKVRVCATPNQIQSGWLNALKWVRDTITSLQQEQPTRGYDEAYLNECIAKARKTWKGVDVDKYMDEMRGREQEQPDNEDIDKVAQELYEHLYELKRRNNVPTNLYDKQEIIDLWKAGVEYAYNHPKQAPNEVELEKEMDNDYDSPLWEGEHVSWMTYTRIARHFYELGLNAKKEETK